MGIFAYALPTFASLGSGLLAALLVVRALRQAPWAELNSAGAFSAWCFLIIMLPIVWRFHVPAPGGIALHLLGMPLFVMMFGCELAIAGLGLSVVAFTWLHDGPWTNLGANLLLMAVIPAWCTEFVMRAIERYLPHHLAVYLLGNGLFGTMAVLGFTGFTSVTANLFWSVRPDFQADTVAYMLLLGWGEAFLTGFLLTIFTVYRPQWVMTFDDDVYLNGK